jgi:Fe-S oxidoreductase
MCPSYQATRDERDSTRGRANALRLALTGQADLAGMTDPALREVLDLCLECKACKAECPTNVDMARLKAEFLHQYHRKHGLPLRNRVFGHVAAVSHWGCRLAPVSNWAVRSRTGRWLNERLLGIDRRRVPPPFAGRTLTWRLAPLRAEGGPGDSLPGVLLFPDTFANFYEPEVGEAAVALLRLAGRAVTLGPPDLRCCGRPLISNGLLDRAVALARHNVTRLCPWAERGWSIVACEPSCLLTIRDDYVALLRGEDRIRAEAVAAACRTFEESLESILAEAEVAPDRPARLKLGEGPRRILVQGHCHQRALVGMGPLLRLLRRVPGAVVVDLDAGCCGMAGSFGYEVEHYEVSQRIGEQRLLPAVRGAGSDAVVVAPGFSCRLQISHLAGRIAAHPAQLLRRLARP